MIDVEKFAPGMRRQIELFRDASRAGMPRRGWKIGINVPEVLARLELPHSGVGWIDGRNVIESGSEFAARPRTRLHVEPEIAVRLSSGVPANGTAGAARDCIESVHPALEIVDYAKPSSGLDDIVAHCMFHEATVLGAAAGPRTADGLDGRFPLLRVADRVSAAPRADLVAADFAELVSFVANFLAAFGVTLDAGDIVLSGSYCAEAMPIAVGEEAVADFGPLGSVSVRISP